MLKTTLLLLVVITTTTTVFGAQLVNATSTFGNLGQKIDEAIDDGKQGYADGKQAAINNYPNYIGECPRSDDDYCIGYTAGYIRGYDAMKTLNN